MDKEEILAKSRKEHQGRDLYKAQLASRAGSVGVLVASALATLFFVVQALTGGGANLGLYAILFALGAAQFIVRAANTRKRREVLLAALYTLVALALSAAHLYSLLAAGAGGAG